MALMCTNMWSNGWNGKSKVGIPSICLTKRLEWLDDKQAKYVAFWLSMCWKYHFLGIVLSTKLLISKHVFIGR